MATATHLSLRRRLAALEAHTPTTEDDPRLKAAAAAFFDAVESLAPFGSAADDPVARYCDYDQRAREWLQRVDAGAETDADRAALAAFPPFHRTLHEMLRGFVEGLVPMTPAEVEALIFPPDRAGKLQG